MKALVTGAAGYVGSTVVSALLDAGDDVVALDDLSRGPARFVERVPHYVGDVADAGLLAAVFAEHPDIEIVIHCAALTLVSDSTAEPLRYYRENVVKAVALFDTLLALGCTRVIFSSSAAVYGSSPPPLVAETAPTEAASPYAATKLMVERILDDVCAATPMSAVSLRYFNPVGADPRLRTGRYDDAPTDALGALLAAATRGLPFRIHGQDWDTPDGTPIRDFVHVWDVAVAHVAAAHRWSAISVGGGHEIVNVGSGRGTSIRELAETVARHRPGRLDIGYDARRSGDTVGCRADVRKARELLGWEPQLRVDDAVRDAVRWAERRDAARVADLDPRGGMVGSA